MKKIIYSIVLFLVTVISCTKQDSILTDEEGNVSLISPKGVSISNSISDLKLTIQSNAKSAFGRKDFFINNITYTENDTQVAAFVEFKSIEGEYGSVLIIGRVKMQNRNSRLMSVMSGSTVVDCSGGCDGAGQTCRERAIFSGGNITYECTCAGSCKMTITNQQ